ncbi:hypothetical protein RFI_23570 [Reticulomyxa filosa]|uniref:Uncharacterized protein n=1 Tax=Reticulomyxa filosa TaxID=46433 RepID=X6MJH0_RETFI|nr:hypothetical protein RFI_23570 [Reticulomyxa filosa]|eukprot:ETO13801.1 hypothetical protein RFI_23570 [Reticulomyxa filosa]
MNNKLYKHIYNVMLVYTDEYLLMKMCLQLLHILVTSIHPKESLRHHHYDVYSPSVKNNVNKSELPKISATLGNLMSVQGGKEERNYSGDNDTKVVLLTREVRRKHQQVLLRSGMVHYMMHVLTSRNNVTLIWPVIRVCKKIEPQLWKNFRLTKPGSTDKQQSDSDKSASKKMKIKMKMKKQMREDEREKAEEYNNSDLSDIDFEIDPSLLRLIRIYQVCSRYHVFKSMIEALTQEDPTPSNIDPTIAATSSPLHFADLLQSHSDALREYLEMIDALVDTNRYTKLIQHQHPNLNPNLNPMYTQKRPEEEEEENENENENEEKVKEKQESGNEDNVIYKIQINNKSYAFECASRYGTFLFWLLRKLGQLLKFVGSRRFASGEAPKWMKKGQWKKKVMDMLLRVVVVVWRLSVYHKPASHLVERDGVFAVVAMSQLISHSATRENHALLIDYYLKIIANMLGAEKRTWHDLTESNGYRVLKAVVYSLQLEGKEAQMMLSNWLAFEQAIVHKCLPLAIEHVHELNASISRELVALITGTTMRQHTMNAPLSVRARMKTTKTRHHGSEGVDKMDAKHRGQQVSTHYVKLRIQLRPRDNDHDLGADHADPQDWTKIKRQREDEKLIAKHLKKIPNSDSSLVPPDDGEQEHATGNDDEHENEDKKLITKNNNINHRWRIWVIVESEKGEVFEQFPFDWVENVLPGNRHVLLSNFEKNKCFMIIYLFVFQSIKLKRKHVCLECIDANDCHFWISNLQELLKFS